MAKDPRSRSGLSAGSVLSGALGGAVSGATGGVLDPTGIGRAAIGGANLSGLNPFGGISSKLGAYLKIAAGGAGLVITLGALVAVAGIDSKAGGVATQLVGSTNPAVAAGLAAARRRNTSAEAPERPERPAAPRVVSEAETHARRQRAARTAAAEALASRRRHEARRAGYEAEATRRYAGLEPTGRRVAGVAVAGPRRAHPIATRRPGSRGERQT